MTEMMAEMMAENMAETDGGKLKKLNKFYQKPSIFKIYIWKK